MTDQAALDRLRIAESVHGYVEVRVTLVSTEAGGRKGPIFTDYRPNWDIGNTTETGDKEYNGAVVSLEDCSEVAPGGTALARLHPLLPEAWERLTVGAEIRMCEGSRVVGLATVLRVALKSHRDST